MGLFLRDNFRQYKKAQEPLYISPKSIQETLEIKKIAPNGMFEVAEGKYSKSYSFDDINYETETGEGQLGILQMWCSFLNSLDFDFKINIVNKPKDMAELRKETLYQMEGDGFDTFRKSMNEHIEDKINSGRQGVEQEKSIIVTVKAKDYEDAKNVFATVEANMETQFLNLRSGIQVMDADERMTLVRSCYRMFDENVIPICFEDYLAGKRDFRNELINYKETAYSDTFFKLDDAFVSCLYVQSYPNDLSDAFFYELTSLPVYSITSVDIVPIPREVGIKRVENIYMAVEESIIKQQRKRNVNGDFSSDISYKTRAEKEQIEGEMEDLKENDQKEFYVGLTMAIMAGSKEELNSITRTVTTLGNKFGCKISVMYKRQRQAFNTCLPIGVRQVDTMRSMQTRSLSALLPFHVQELSYKRPSHYYGINQLSKNVLLGNRKKLLNGNGFIFGVSGGGKSFKTKEEILSVFLTVNENGSKDDIIIVDPQNEYEDIAEILSGVFINLSTHAKEYINPLDVDLKELEVNDTNDIIRDKCEFMLGICEQCLGSRKMSQGLGYDSIIDRCVRLMYEETAKKPLVERRQPLLLDFARILKEQPEEEAKKIALAMEVFISGSLNLFNNQTTLDVKNRVTIYGIKELGEKLRPLAMLVMLENIKNRIFLNHKRGIATWLYIDEIHVLMHDAFTIDYLQNLWKIVRKFGGLITGITQNIIDLTKNETSRTMISNSEFVVLLKQSGDDADEIVKTIEGITTEQLRYVTGAPAGTGLLKHGNIFVPFDSRIDKESILYWIFNTNPHEQEERKRRLRAV